MKAPHRGWLLLLLPLLLVSIACNLSAVRRWAAGGGEDPTPEGPTATPSPTAEAPPPPSSPAPPSSCGDGVCDAHERQHPDRCPEDCFAEEGVYVGEVALDMDALNDLQAMVDQGHYPWRLDPLEVARAEGERLGFDPARDTFDLLPTPDPATGQADVLVLHGDRFYIIHLTQPVRVGLGGIWAVVGVDRGL